MSLAPEENLQRNFTYEWASGAAIPVLSVALAVIVGGFVVLLAGGNPLNAYWQLVQGAFGSPYQITETLFAAIPLIFTGLAVAFAFKSGLFNIGAEGQLYMGGILSAWIGYHLNMPGIFLISIALFVGALGGAVWGGIVGFLKAKRGAHEVVTTIMLNYVAILVSRFLVEPTPSGKPGPMEQRIQVGNPSSPPMNAQLPVIIPQSWVSNDRLHLGLFLALAAAAICYFLLWRTTLGYKIRAVGHNPKAAAYAGINVGVTMTLSMVIAGAFAGLGGMVTLYGSAPYQLTDTFSPGFGFDAIAVALLGRNTSLGVVLAAILFGAFDHGGAIMQSNTGISSHLIEILQGLIILFIGADAIVRYLARRGVISLPRWQRAGAPA